MVNEQDNRIEEAEQWMEEGAGPGRSGWDVVVGFGMGLVLVVGLVCGLGWTLADYLRCVDMYSAVGIDLTREPLVGVGSICSRQSTTQVAQIIWELADLGLRLHGFGVKRSGICQLAGALVSADSMAWSFRARRDQPLPGCKHRKCTNCIRYATHWRTRLLRDLHPQLRLRV